MIKKYLMFAVIILSFGTIRAQDTIFPGADERTPSRAEYFSWINNTNEGATEKQTLINLEFFNWLQRRYGMQLDIYAFDAGAIDGKRFYGSIHSERFTRQFPRGFDPIYKKAKSMGVRLGVWGGPDGFGDTPEEERARIEQMVSLCLDYNFALFKFDAVCGPLRPEKEDVFITMMKKCRQYCPDLILLNHRLGLRRAKQYATTFLWQGWETYIDVFMNNWMTALHHRAAALSRGLPPDLERLTEDHGVCLSSCLDYWEDDLVLQAFNRGLILAPQLYGNPWLLRDDEFPLLARIFTLHRKYRDILVQGLLLPEETCGPNAVSRGDGSTRLITLRNLTWKPADYSLDLDEQIGLENNGRIEVRRLHPTEEILGRFDYGSRLTMTVEPFRSCLLIVSSRTIDEPTVRGAPFQVTRNMAGKPVELNILGWPGGSVDISLADASQYSRVLLDGKEDTILSGGGTRKVTFPGRPLTEKILRNVADFNEVPLDSLDWRPLYEATVFSADNNALEVRSLERSGWSSIPQVRAAQEAFFSQPVFVQRGVWDKNLFDGSLETGFWPSKKYNRPVVIEGGCLRLDLGKITDLDKIVIKVGDTFSLHPLLKEEGNHVEVSDDLIHWRTITYLAGLVMEIPLSRPVRYLRFKYFPSRILEIEGYKDGRMVDRGTWRASNLFAHPDRLQAAKIWRAQLQLQEIAPHSYLCIALNGEHGEEGAYVGAKIDGILRGAPDRAVSYPSNTWEYLVGGSDKNYTYYIPLRSEDIGKLIELYVIGFNEEKLDFRPEAYINAYPVPYKSIPLLLDRKSK